MKDAPATWALIVGIDSYDNVKHLTGAARDAAAAARWLLDLGVPPKQILLHAAPIQEAADEVAQVGLPLGGCREPEIWASFETLMQNSGRRLFVFLCGHGFFEPGGDRVFLTREASERAMKNLGIDWYAAFLLGLPYDRQFLIMDGCLNLPYTPSERTRFRAGEQSSIVPDPPRREVMQHFCYGASQGERASEVDGRGIFLKTLLDTLDLKHPHADCVDVDDEEGTLVLDLECAVRDVCAPTVARIAASLGRTQQPGIQMLSMGPTPRTLPVVRLTSQGAANVRVVVDPADACDHVARLQLWSYNNIFTRRLPVPPDVKVTVPYVSRLPLGLALSVRCTVEPNGRWVQPAQQDLIADQDREVVFTLEPPAPPAAATEIKLNTTSSMGDIVPGMSGAAYERVEELLAGADEDIELEPHETGPLLRSMSARPAQMWDVAHEVAIAINEHTAPEISVVIQGLDAGEIGAAVELPISAAAGRRLGGLLQGEPVVEVGEHQRSLRQLADDPLVSVEPGPVTIRLTLPWGEWHERVVVDQATPTRVKLPKKVGVPPLRVRVLSGRARPPKLPPFGVVTLGKSAMDGTVLDGANALLGRLKPTSRHVSRPDVGQSELPRWRTYAAANGLVFPLSAEGAVALDPVAEPRAEPLSWTSEPNWDRLVSSGHLEDLDEEQASMLTYAKWESPLLGLAGAYACYARGRDDLLTIVLHNLAGLDGELPDLSILEAALDRLHDAHRPETARRLEALGTPAAVPLFRWGVGIGVLAAEHYGLPDLEHRYRELEPRLVAGSVWTLWRG